MRHALVITLVTVVCGVLAVPAAAVEPGWTIRVFGAGFDPSLSETVINDDGDNIDVSAGTDLGFGAGLEYRFSDLFGLELGGFWGSPEVELSTEVPDFGLLVVSDALSTRVMTLDLNLHLTPSSPSFDVAVGIGAAHLEYGSLHYEVNDEDILDVNIDSDLTWSARANVDIALGSGSDWIAFGGLRYIWTDLEATEANDPTRTSENFDFNIFSFSVGVGYRF